MKHLLLLILTVAFAPQMMAQSEPEYTMEIGAGAGLMHYEGDFNGDITKCGQPGAALWWRNLFNPRMGLRVSFDYGKLKASTKNLKTVYPDQGTSLREADDVYDFNHSLYDLNCVFEYNFWPYGTGREYRGAKRVTPFVFAGLGLTYADCSEKDVFTANLPLGLGLKYKIGERMNLNVEWTMHFSMSDGLDGVKDPYHVKTSGLFKNSDCYSTLMVGITYSFKEKCRVCHNSDE